MRPKRKRSADDYLVTTQMLQGDGGLQRVISDVNAMDGPEVCADPERGGWGLRARRSYTVGQRLTTYGGKIVPLSNSTKKKINSLLDIRMTFRHNLRSPMGAS